jgi:hypothetical protein
MIDRAIQQRRQSPDYNPNPFGSLLSGIGTALFSNLGKPGQARMSLLGGDAPTYRNPFTGKEPSKQVSAVQGLLGVNPAFTSQAAPALAPVNPLSLLSPEDRAYQQERARVEAMVKSNPDMQKQEIAEARAKVRDQGMEAWAKANPELAKKVMPGQSGFSAIQGVVGRMPAPSDNPLMARTFGYQTGGAPDQQIGAPTIGPTPAALQVDAALNPASPSFVGGEGAPIYDFTRDDLTPELLEKFQQQLLKQAK